MISVLQRSRVVLPSILLLLALTPAHSLIAQQSDAPPVPTATPATPAPDNPDYVPAAKGNDRILGVLPNFLTTDNTLPFSPLSAKTKVSLSVQESYDWPIFFFNGAVAFLYFEGKEDPSYGRGLGGFGKEYLAVTADDTLSNLFTDGLMPALLHQDPRYFRKASGSIPSRIGFALAQSVIARNDSGKWQFASAEWLGNVIAVGISDTYHRDSRTLLIQSNQVLFQVGENTWGNIMDEFWPDIKKKFFIRHKTTS